MADKRGKGNRDEDLVFDTHLRGRLYQGVGGEGDVSGARKGDLREQLLAAYGRGRRGGVNTAAAAADLGVSKRTVERWITSAGEKIGKPRKATSDKLRKRAKQSATTKAGRRRTVEARKGDRASKYGARLNVTGYQGTWGKSRWYMRDRTTKGDLTADQVEQMRDAYVEGGDKGLAAWLHELYEGNYLDEWKFGEIHDLYFTDPREG